MLSTFMSLLLLIMPASHGYGTPEDFEKDTSPLKLLVFLSENCPCSRSHIEHLNQLQKRFPQLKIFGVISEPATPETRVKSEAYFQGRQFDFTIIDDPGQRLVKTYKALKTPHATLFQKQEANAYLVVYEGGLTNQKDFDKSTLKYVEANLIALQDKKPLPHANGASLGCYIRRL